MTTELPPKYQKIYDYAYRVCETLKSKTPIHKFSNENGNFMMMSDKPNSFEAQLSNGVKTIYQVKSQTIKIIIDDQTYTINLNEDISHLDERINWSVKTTLSSLSMCLQ